MFDGTGVLVLNKGIKEIIVSFFSSKKGDLVSLFSSTNTKSLGIISEILFAIIEQWQLFIGSITIKNDDDKKLNGFILK